MALVLSDFDASGLSVEFLALLERPNTTDTRVLYADTSHGPNPGQAPVEGELGIGPDETVISRLLNQANENLTLNDRDLPAALALGGYLGPTGAGNSMTLWFQREGVARAGMLLSAVTVSGGGNYANIALPRSRQGDLEQPRGRRAVPVRGHEAGGRSSPRCGGQPHGRSLARDYRCGGSRYPGSPWGGRHAVRRPGDCHNRRGGARCGACS